MEDTTLLEFIWNISNKIAEFVCSIKLNDFLLVLSLFLIWKLAEHIVFIYLRW